MKKVVKDKKYYSSENYKPTKRAKKVTYKGVEYLSKVQCMVLNDIDAKTLDEYLKNN